MSGQNNLPSIFKSAVFLVGGIAAYFIWAREWDRKFAHETLSEEPNRDNLEDSEELTKSVETNESQNRETRRAKSSKKNNNATEEPYYQKLNPDKIK